MEEEIYVETMFNADKTMYTVVIQAESAMDADTLVEVLKHYVQAYADSEDEETIQ